MEYSNLFVCLMGICTVFIGLICIIFLVTVMSGIVRKADREGKQKVAEAASSAPAGVANKGAAAAGTASGAGAALTPQVVAAVSAAIAEDMGTDISGFRIVSFKKVS